MKNGTPSAIGPLSLIRKGTPANGPSAAWSSAGENSGDARPLSSALATSSGAASDRFDLGGGDLAGPHQLVEPDGVVLGVLVEFHAVEPAPAGRRGRDGWNPCTGPWTGLRARRRARRGRPGRACGRRCAGASRRSWGRGRGGARSRGWWRPAAAISATRRSAGVSAPAPAPAGGRGRPPASSSSARARSHRAVARQACAASCASRRIARAARRSPAARRRAPSSVRQRASSSRAWLAAKCVLASSSSAIAGSRGATQRAHPGGVPERPARAPARPPVPRRPRLPRRLRRVRSASTRASASSGRHGGSTRCARQRRAAIRARRRDPRPRARRRPGRAAGVRGCRAPRSAGCWAESGRAARPTPSSCSASSRRPCSASAITSHGVARPRGEVAPGLDGAARLELAAGQVAALVGDLRLLPERAGDQLGQTPSPRRRRAARPSRARRRRARPR